MAGSASIIYCPDRGPAPPMEEIGGKAYHLARLAAVARETGAEFAVPPWIAIRAGAFESGVPECPPQPLSAAALSRRQASIRGLELPADLRAEVLDALAVSGLREKRLAVRSSAVGEDSAAASFAGQFDSVLGVVVGPDGGSLWEALRQVWASTLNDRAVAYRQRQGAAGEARVRMAVILHEMVDAAVSGVVFSVDPVTGDDDTAVVSAVYGLGEGLVSGELDADTYRVRFVAERPAEVRREIVRKERAVRMTAEGGTRLEPVPAPLWDRPALTDAEARQIAMAARQIARAFGRPQDVEWALTEPAPGERRLLILQARAITTDLSGPRFARCPPSPTRGGGAHAKGPSSEPSPWPGPAPSRVGKEDGGLGSAHLTSRPSPTRGGGAQAGAGLGTSSSAAGDRPPSPSRGGAGGGVRLWDNSNIIESYGGVTTPLTFSFARSVYEDVYRQFCFLMGVSESLVEQHRHVFATMLGLVQGRVYYNLLNWYRALALLPGFSLNRAFMERMMGVSEKLEHPPEPPRAASRAADLVRLVRMVVRMLRECRRLRTEVPRFHARVEAVLAPLAGEEFSAWSADDLAALYRRLEDELLRHWRAPLVNDFFAMISFGVLCRLIERWLPKAPPTLANDLLCGEGGIISTEPARQVMALAGQVVASPALAALFAAEPDEGALWAAIQREAEFAAFRREINAYLERFGDRCMNELKLETVTLGEDPGFLLRMIRAYAAQGMVSPDEAREREAGIRRAAEGMVRARLGWMRRGIFRVVLRQARRRVRDRENLRFERTRVFGLVRRIFRALGGHLAPDQLAEPRDIFYLTKEEIFGTLDGTAVTTDLKALVALRKAEFAAYAAGPVPPERFETTGSPAHDLPAGPLRPAAGGVPCLNGTGCCPGVVRAPVRIVHDPQQARNLEGHILVAERTDPGWTLLFPAARGLLVQRGSLLSHSAIVAREVGLPCVVGIAGLLETLREGEWVEMDGATGQVRRLGGAAEPEP